MKPTVRSKRRSCVKRSEAKCKAWSMHDALLRKIDLTKPTTKKSTIRVWVKGRGEL
jgi:hypothetical protein